MIEYKEWVNNKKARGQDVASRPTYSRHSFINTYHMDKRRIRDKVKSQSSNHYSDLYNKLVNEKIIYKSIGDRERFCVRARHLLRTLRVSRLESGTLICKLENKISGQTMIYDGWTGYASSIVNDIQEFVYFERVLVMSNYRRFYRTIQQMKTKRSAGIWSYIDNDDESFESPTEDYRFYLLFQKPEDSMMFKLKYGHTMRVETDGIVLPRAA